MKTKHWIKCEQISLFQFNGEIISSWNSSFLFSRWKNTYIKNSPYFLMVERETDSGIKYKTQQTDRTEFKSLFGLLRKVWSCLHFLWLLVRIRFYVPSVSMILLCSCSYSVFFSCQWKKSIRNIQPIAAFVNILSWKWIDVSPAEPGDKWKASF